jgi:hypothetical protein
LADPATQFQPAGLNIGYQYQPVETRLNPPIQLPGTGELWAKVGDTAMRAANMLMNSPINPAVREELQARYKSAQEGINQFNALDKAGVGPLMYTVDEQGRARALAPGEIQDKTMATQILSRLGIGPKLGTGGGGGTGSIEPGTATGGTQKTETKPPTAEEAGGAKETKPKPPTAEQAGGGQASAVGLVPSQGGSTAALTAGPGGVLNTGQPQSPDIEAVPAAQYRAQQQGGSIWSPQGPSPMPPPAPTAGPQMTLGATAQPPPGMGLGGTDQAALASWQAQNAHPVMSSNDALNWAKNYDTGAQRATYLQNGGPNGEPAYAFHMKGGGVNTVPISQIVKNGGAALVAGQNTSASLSASDAITNQPPPGQAPGMTLGATAQPPPGMALGAAAQPLGGVASFGQPPAAPGMTDIYGNPLSAYTSVASQGGQTPDQLTAQTTGAGQTAEPPLGARVTPPEPPLPNNNVISQEDQAKIQAAADAMPKLDPNKPYAGDREVQFPGSPYHWHIDDNPESGGYKGRIYTSEPPDPGNLFNPRRWYLGDEGYRSVELPASEMRNEMKYWINRGDVKAEEVLNMPEDEMKTWLKRKWEFQNLRMNDPDAGTANTLNGGAEYVKAIAQVRDNLNALKALGVNPNSLGKLWYAGEGAVASLGFPEPFSGDPHKIKAYKNLEQSLNRADSIATNYKNLLLQQGKGGGAGVNIPLWLFGGRVSTDLKADIPESSRTTDVFSGGSVGSKLMDIDSIYNDATQKYGNMVQDSHGQWLRISPRHDVNVNKLDANKELDDRLNNYTGGRVPVAYEDFEDFRKKHSHVRVNLRMPDGTIVPGRTE